MTPDTGSDDLRRLLRWEQLGGVWRVLARRRSSLVVSLCRCDGGEEVERFTSEAPDLAAHVADRWRSED